MFRVAIGALLNNAGKMQVQQCVHPTAPISRPIVFCTAGDEDEDHVNLMFNEFARRACFMGGEDFPFNKKVF